MKSQQLLIASLGLILLGGACTSASAQAPKIIKKKTQKKTDKDLNASAEPDKVLYERAQADLKHGRYVEGRLALQTLINTYPDSEYLAKAKLAVADSYYKEGGTSNLTQAVAEYKDFITFFPFLEEAAYAQMQVGMAHYKMMEKPDRDNSQAQMAEDEFQAMLLKYPQSPFVPQAEQHLREVQEVLAAGEYKIGHFYYTKQDYRASAARLIEVTTRYPLYSQSDEALWLLGDIYTRLKTGNKNEDVRNYWATASGKIYDRIVQDYPLSPRAADAKKRLAQMGMPIPAADPAALARMQKEQEYSKHSAASAVLKVPVGMMKGSPDVTMAAHSGQPNLTPPDDAVAASEVLKPNGTPGMSVSGATTTGAAADSSEVTTQEDAETTGASAVQATGAAGNNLGVQIIRAPDAEPAPAAATGTSTAPGAAAPAPQTDPAPASAPPAANPPATAAPNDNATSSSSTSSTQTGSNSPSGSAQTDQSSTDSASAASDQSGATPASTDPKQDSTSKKKKGARKLIPW